MLETSARLLRLLSHLQTPREWTGTELAERLEVSTRTVRRDVERLRALGYPVQTAMGARGGYRLEAGAKLPPLLLDDDEAVAVAVSLRAAAGGSVAGIEEPARRALGKLEQVLPKRLRGPVRALESATVRLSAGEEQPKVDPEVLTVLAAACRDRQSLRFDYSDHEGAQTYRRTEPLRIVSWGDRWYLVAFDLDRDDWCTFRIDRLRPRGTLGPGFEPRELPDGDVADYLPKRFGDLWRYRARFLVRAPAEQIAPGISPVDGVVEAVDENTCTLTIGGNDPVVMVAFLCMFGEDFELLESDEAAGALRTLIDRCRGALGERSFER